MNGRTVIDQIAARLWKAEAERDQARRVARQLATYIDGLLAGPPSGELTLACWLEALAYPPLEEV